MMSERYNYKQADYICSGCEVKDSQKITVIAKYSGERRQGRKIQFQMWKENPTEFFQGKPYAVQ